MNDFQKLNKELREINAEREEDSYANALIIKQISTMKSVIEDFKDREKDKEQLLLKIKDKDFKIKQLQSKNDSHTKCKVEIEDLRKENKFLGVEQAHKIQSIETKFQALYKEYKATLEENKRLL